MWPWRAENNRMTLTDELRPREQQLENRSPTSKV
jgi:hypothetical protein